MKLIDPAVIREDFAFLRRQAWALTPLWLIAAAISWALPDDQFHLWTIWGQFGVIIAVLARPPTGPNKGGMIYASSYLVFLLTHLVRWHFFGW